ncbi:ABC transporter permease [Sorangium sp. So ce1000]|uniref:ABC transporter permease n=1 Tax=Sorangium sp. So ce1000 TaxID=3133325 RepID=UPI003F622FD3
MLLKIAFRNILRNGRRSLVTLLAIAVGAVSLVLFGEFSGYIKAALETNAVEKSGHLTIFRTGYFDYGAGNPAAFAINDYREIIRLVEGDPEIKPKLNVITPTVSVTGIVGNFEIDASKTFLGTGYVPADRARLLKWDQYGVMSRRVRPPLGLRDDDESVGIVGVGVARVLGLCEPLKIENCPPRPQLTAANTPPPDESIAALSSMSAADVPAQGGGAPRLDLLAAQAGGAPNVVSLFVSHAELQPARELDENVIVMNFGLAQKLLYGRSEPKATGIVLQLNRTADIAPVRNRLVSIFRERHLDLEVREFSELEPFYKQAVGMFGAIFAFIANITGVIVLFTVVNTMAMSVVERTNEIGTVRAMGVRRSGIRGLFIVEGIILGVVGATLGVGLAQLTAIIFNNAGATWTPPGQASRVPLQVMTSNAGGLLLGVWIALVVLAAIAAAVPANRAARLKVVDALRHV